MCLSEELFPHPRMLRGFFKFFVLYVLKDEPLHGYGVMQRIEEILHGQYTPSPGIVYPTLQLLEDMGYVKPLFAEGKKLYSITEEGRRALEENMDKVREAIESTARFKKFIHDLYGFELLNAVRLLFKSIPSLGDEKVSQIRSLILDFTRRLLEVVGR